MSDRIFGGVALGLAALYYLLARGIPRSDLADATGPSGLPVTYAVVLTGLALVLLAQSWTVRSAVLTESPMTAVPRANQPGLWRAAATLATGVVYLLLVPHLGYVLSVAALIATTTCAHGGRLDRRTAVVAVGGAVVLWLLFVWLLGIPEPPGWWPSLLGLAGPW